MVNMTMLTLKKKGFWDIVTGDPMNGNIAAQIASYERDAARAAEIIKAD